jgi:hypothetical protein
MALPFFGSRFEVRMSHAKPLSKLMHSQRIRAWPGKNFVLKNHHNAVGRTFCDAIILDPETGSC